MFKKSTQAEPYDSMPSPIILVPMERMGQMDRTEDEVQMLETTAMTVNRYNLWHKARVHQRCSFSVYKNSHHLKTKGGDGHEGDDGGDGRDAIDFDVRVEFKHHNPVNNIRTYSIETVDGGMFCN